jgi:hypothetical protein
MRQFAIIGQHDQAFAVRVQPTDHEQVHIVTDRDVIHDRGTIILTLCFGRRHHVYRLVQRVIEFRLVEFEAHTIDFDNIGLRVSFIAQRRHFTIDAHPPAFDQGFTGTARADIRLCHQFL